MFVIIEETGEYSDRWITVLGYIHSEADAQQLVINLTKGEQIKRSIAAAKSKLHIEFIHEYDKKNPYPIFEEQKPMFDQRKHADKEYVKAHTIKKTAYTERQTAFCRDFVNPWSAARDEAVNAYVEANFTMDMCKPPEWTDAQYHYEEIKELILGDVNE